MPADGERERLTALLARLGADDVARRLRFAYAREGAHVYTSRMVTRTLDVPVELIVYPLHSDPGLVVDYEEERALLASLEAGGHDAPRVLLADRTAELGLLMTAAPAHAKRLRESATAGEQLRYDAEKDRLIGGDTFRQLGDEARELSGCWSRQCLLPQARGEQLIALLRDADSAYARLADTDAPPFLLPVPLALITGDPGVAVGGAPPEFQRLAYLVIVISGAHATRPGERDALETMARRLFTVIAGVHAAGASLSSNAGTCVWPGMVTPAGGLMDVYFINREAAHEGWQHDLYAGLLTITDGTVPTDLRPAMAAAARGYLRTERLPSAVDEQLTICAAALAGTGVRVVDPLRVLAGAVLTHRRS
jgi:hypothetical protein